MTTESSEARARELAATIVTECCGDDSPFVEIHRDSIGRLLQDALEQERRLAGDWRHTVTHARNEMVKLLTNLCDKLDAVSANPHGCSEHELLAAAYCRTCAEARLAGAVAQQDRDAMKILSMYEESGLRLPQVEMFVNAIRNAPLRKGGRGHSLPGL